MPRLQHVLLTGEGTLTKPRLDWVLSGAEGVTVADTLPKAVREAVPTSKLEGSLAATSWAERLNAATQRGIPLVVTGLPFDAEATVAELSALSETVKSPLRVLFLCPSWPGQTVVASLGPLAGLPLKTQAKQEQEWLGGTVLALGHPSQERVVAALQSGREDLLLLVGFRKPRVAEAPPTDAHLAPGLHAASIVQVLLTDWGVQAQNRTPFTVRAEITLTDDFTGENLWSSDLVLPPAEAKDVPCTQLGAAGALPFPQAQRRHWSHSTETVYEGGRVRLGPVLFRFFDGDTLLGEHICRSRGGFGTSAGAREIHAATDTRCHRWNNGHMTDSEIGRPRAVFVDVDGTMIDHFGPVSPAVTEAIRKARAGGHRFFICTGRGAADVPESVTAVGFDGAITNGGAFARVGDELVVARTMGAALAGEVVDYLSGLDVGILVQTDERTYRSENAVDLSEKHDRAYRSRRKAELEAAGEDPSAIDDTASFADRVRTFPPLSKADPAKIVKIVFISDREVDLAQVQRDLGEEVQVIDGSLPLSEGTSAEICVANVTKGFAITQVAEHLGMPLADTVGIGDSWNDLEMFQVVGDSVVMENADPQLKRHAKLETVSVREDGVARALEKLGILPAGR